MILFWIAQFSLQMDWVPKKESLDCFLTVNYDDGGNPFYPFSVAEIVDKLVRWSSFIISALRALWINDLKK